MWYPGSTNISIQIQGIAIEFEKSPLQIATQFNSINSICRPFFEGLSLKTQGGYTP